MHCVFSRWDRSVSDASAAAAAKSLTEIIPLIGLSAISGQYPVFSHPESL